MAHGLKTIKRGIMNIYSEMGMTVMDTYYTVYDCERFKNVL